MILRSLVALLLILAVFGCKRAKEEKADLGPEISADLIDEELSKAVTGVSLDNVKLNQYVNYVVLRRIENAETVSVLGTTRVKVFAVDDLGDYNRFILQISKAFRKNDGSFRNIDSEDPLPPIAKPKQSSIATFAAAPAPVTTTSLKAWAKDSGRVSATAKTTFHHLVVKDGTFPIPDLVRERSDCGGLSPCELPVRYISFDLVSWNSETDYQKVSLDFGFSKHTPYLPFGAGFDLFNGTMIMDCRATYVQLETRNVYVRDCQQLDDFQK